MSAFDKIINFVYDKNFTSCLVIATQYILVQINKQKIKVYLVELSYQTLNRFTEN